MWRWVLAGVLFSPLAQGAGASQVIPGVYALTVDNVVAEKGKLCSARAPASAEDWNMAIDRFRKANASSLADMASVAERLKRDYDAGNAKNASAPSYQNLVISQFFTMALDNVHYELALANDSKAREICERWKAGIGEGGALERQLPHGLELARKLIADPAAKPE